MSIYEKTIVNNVGCRLFIIHDGPGIQNNYNRGVNCSSLGMGRSRMMDPQTTANYRDLTTERTDGKKSEMGDVKRGDIKIDNFEETKLLNFYSGVGINFQNIASNDAVVSSKLNEMAKEGWSLVFVTSGVESDAGKQDGEGIYITRYIFKK